MCPAQSYSSEILSIVLAMVRNGMRAEELDCGGDYLKGWAVQEKIAAQVIGTQHRSTRGLLGVLWIATVLLIFTKGSCRLVHSM
jgi:hypothetical protein